MPYWQLYYHLVWATREREPLLHEQTEQLIYPIIQSIAHKLDATIYAINGMPDHVHIIAAIPPKLVVAMFVGKVKGATAAIFNKTYGSNGHLYWQSEYGAFSFDNKRLPYLIAYVDNQKQHHQQGTLIPVLERTDASAFKSVQEQRISYNIDDIAWCEEMIALE